MGTHHYSPYERIEEADQSFIWEKKEEKDGLKRLSNRKRQRLAEKHRCEIQQELLHIETARREREKIRQERLKEKEQQFRDTERIASDFWQKEEEAFFLKQELLRTKIRLEGGRPQPIDHLAVYITNAAGALEQPLQKYIKITPGGPYDYLVGLTRKDLEVLLHDIRTYRKVHAGHGDLYQQFWANIDVIVRHECHLLNRIETNRSGTDPADEDGLTRGQKLNSSVASDVYKRLKDKTLKQLLLLSDTIQSKINSKDRAIDVTYWEMVMDILQVHLAKSNLLETHQQLLLHHPLAERGEDTGEHQEELQTQDEVMLGDRFSPRKPLFHNTVHTGYSWNRYNRVHYDKDNPPPKTIFGYKFTLFYPDLMDKTQHPHYTVEPERDNPDFATITFRAGPPYENVAFRILNRKWDRRRRSDFHNAFDGKVLKLWFRFQRTSYRR